VKKSAKRGHSISFRLVPNSLKAASEEVAFSEAEYKAVAKAAGDVLIGTFVRELITAASRHAKGELATDRAHARARVAGLPRGAYYRLIVLETIGHHPLCPTCGQCYNVVELAQDLASARRWFAKRP